MADSINPPADAGSPPSSPITKFLGGASAIDKLARFSGLCVADHENPPETFGCAESVFQAFLITGNAKSKKIPDAVGVGIIARQDNEGEIRARIQIHLTLEQVAQDLFAVRFLDLHRHCLTLIRKREFQLLRNVPVQPVAESPGHCRHQSFHVQVEAGADDIVISAAVELTCRRGRAEIIDGKTGKVATPGRPEPKISLIQTLVQAEYWRSELLKNPAISLHDLLKSRVIQPGYVRRLLNAAYLAPAIKRAIFQGTQPPDLQVQDLLRPRSMDWNTQMREMGFLDEETIACH